VVLDFVKIDTMLLSKKGFDVTNISVVQQAWTANVAPTLGIVDGAELSMIF
jgi:hypothetical protein